VDSISTLLTFLLDGQLRGGGSSSVASAVFVSSTGTGIGNSKGVGGGADSLSVKLGVLFRQVFPLLNQYREPMRMFGLQVCAFYSELLFFLPHMM